MRGQPITPVAVAIAATAGAAAVVVALVLVLTAAPSGDTAAPSAPSVPSAVAAPVPSSQPRQEGASMDEEDEGYEERLPAGTAWPLKLGEATRNRLAEAARRAGAGPAALTAAVHGTLYYGVVYGETEPADAYYVVSTGLPSHAWTRPGRGDWRYLGAYSADDCLPAAPRTLFRVWNLQLSTRFPFPESPCAPPA
ncbi:hypothetical protein [Microbispora corallina]|nr:hypothetical protein [Microbispora corallina]